METIFDLCGHPAPPSTLPVLTSDPEQLSQLVWAELDPVWAWLVTTMDSVETQIRLGNSISDKAPFRSKCWIHVLSLFPVCCRAPQPDVQSCIHMYMYMYVGKRRLV